MAKRGRRPKSIIEEAPTATSVIEQLPIVPPFDLVLGIRKIRKGAFLGLWELTKLSVNLETTKVIKVLTDANLKSLVVASAAKELSRCI